MVRKAFRQILLAILTSQVICSGDHSLPPSSAKYQNLAKFANSASVWEGGFDMVRKAFRQILLAILTSQDICRAEITPCLPRRQNLAKFTNLASVWEGGFNMVRNTFRQILLAILTSQVICRAEITPCHPCRQNTKIWPNLRTCARYCTENSISAGWDAEYFSL